MDRKAPLMFIAVLTLTSLLSAQTTSPATQPSTQPAKDIPRPFTTMQAIFQNIPQDLHPQATKEWHKFTESKFIDWWQKQLPGLQLNESFPLSNCFLIGGGGKEPTWTVYLTLGSKPFTYFGENHSYAISIPPFTVHETEARKWDAAKHGTLIPVKGTIDSATISISPRTYSPTQLPAYGVTFHLKDLQFNLPK